MLAIEDGSVDSQPSALADQAGGEPDGEALAIVTDIESDSESGGGGRGADSQQMGSTDALCGSPPPPLCDDDDDDVISDDDGELSPKTVALLASVDESIRALNMEEHEREAQENQDRIEANALHQEPQESSRDSPQPELELDPEDSEDSVDPEDKKQDLYPYEGDRTSHGKGAGFDDAKEMHWLQSQVADLKRRKAAKMLTLL